MVNHAEHRSPLKIRGVCFSHLINLVSYHQPTRPKNVIILLPSPLHYIFTSQFPSTRLIAPITRCIKHQPQHQRTERGIDPLNRSRCIPIIQPTTQPLRPSRLLQPQTTNYRIQYGRTISLSKHTPLNRRRRHIQPVSAGIGNRTR